MSKVILPKFDLVDKHVNEHYDKTCEICYPLFKNTPLTYFEYAIFFDSGEGVCFATHVDLVSQFFSNTITPRFADFKILSLSGLKTIYLSHGIPVLFDSSYLRDRYEHNIACASDVNLYHRLYLVERHSDYYQVAGFGTADPSDKVFNFYLNTLGYLEKFVKYFESHVEELILASQPSDRLIIPEYFDPKIIPEVNASLALNLPDFEVPMLNQSAPRSIAMTKREQACLELVAQGYTMKNAAKKLDISHRTVETHLRNIKEKHGIYTRNELADLWRDMLHSE